MSDALPIRFHRYSARREIRPGDALWDERLPEDRRAGVSGAGVSLGDYFTAVADFLNGPGRSALRTGVAALAGPLADPSEVEAVDVVLEKHGALYHPARVEVRVSGGSAALVLNAAVSEAGRRTLPGEFENLRRLGARRDFSGLPAVFGMGAGRGTAGEFPMFLGEWLTGFQEFHLSRDEGGEPRIVVWGGDGVRRVLAPGLSGRLYSEVARLLARHYDSETGDQVFSWHHAAGDFVVRTSGDALAVRLISVRGYGPLFGAPDPADDPRGLDGLLRFLANLGLRTRVDRLDGVGDAVLADPSVLEPTVAGALAGLADRGGPADAFRTALRGKSPAELAEVTLAVLDTWRSDSPETGLLRDDLASHVLSFWEAVNCL